MASVRIVNALEHPACLKGAACAFGVFDGLHLGHRYIIERAVEAAHADDCACVVLTFDIDPDELFAGEKLHKLMGNEERIAALAQTGADVVAVIPFTREFAALKPNEFLDNMFSESEPSSLHIGCDLRFGSHARGSVETLRAWGLLHNMRVCAYDLLEIEGAPVTSTRIRTLLDAGDIEGAQRLLGR